MITPKKTPDKKLDGLVREMQNNLLMISMAESDIMRRESAYAKELPDGRLHKDYFIQHAKWVQDFNKFTQNLCEALLKGESVDEIFVESDRLQKQLSDRLIALTDLMAANDENEQT